MAENYLLAPFLFIIGTVFGSFFGVLSDRLPKEKTILGRSYCDYCKKTLQGRDMIPILSYFLLQGKTRCCKKKLSFFYPSVEFITGIAFVLTWFFLGQTPGEKIIYVGIVSALIVIFFADAKYQIIPDSMQVLLILFGIFLKLTLGLPGVIFIIYSLIDGLIILAPILFLFLITRGRGMGFGDVKLAFVMGFLLGWQGGLVALYVAFITGSITGIMLMIKGKKKFKSKIAFGPFLIVGTLSMLFFHENIFYFLSRFFQI